MRRERAWSERSGRDASGAPNGNWAGAAAVPTEADDRPRPKRVQPTFTRNGSLDARLVLLVFGVLLVVCGISVGVSEAFKHDRTTTTTDQPPHRARRGARRDGEGPPGGHRVPAGHGPRAAAVAVARADRSTRACTARRCTVSGSCPDTGPVNRCKADIDLASRSMPMSWSRATAVTSPPSAWPAISSCTTDSGDVTARDLNAISVAATTNAATSTSTSPPSRLRQRQQQLRRRARHRARRRRVPRRRHDRRRRRSVEGVLRNDRALRSIAAHRRRGRRHRPRPRALVRGTSRAGHGGPAETRLTLYEG